MIRIQDGLPGCGKTLFSSLISTFDRVELLNYAPETEHACLLYSLGKVSIDAAKVMVNIETDMKLYHTMMGRDVNFRLSDLSSVAQNHDPARYIQRIFGEGDKVIPEVINQQKPILNLAVHNVLGDSEPIWQALGDRCIFIHIERHPLYMVRQQELNMRSIGSGAIPFFINYTHDGTNEIPGFAYEWEDEFISSSNSMERTVHFINKRSKHARVKKGELLDKYQANILTIPFEKFVLDPEPWMGQIYNIIGTSASTVTSKEMDKHKVPRKMIADGIDLEIYRRCGWEPPKGETSERDELNIRREDVSREVSSDMLDILDKLSEEYENQYWNPDV